MSAVAIPAVRDAGGLRVLVGRRHPRSSFLGGFFAFPGGAHETDDGPLAAGDEANDATLRRTAARELEEETGLRAASWQAVRTFLPAPGFCSERLHLFGASGLTELPGGGRACDSDEEIEVLRMRPEEVLRVEPADAKTLIAALWALGRMPA